MKRPRACVVVVVGPSTSSIQKNNRGEGTNARIVFTLEVTALLHWFLCVLTINAHTDGLFIRLNRI